MSELDGQLKPFEQGLSSRFEEGPSSPSVVARDKDLQKRTKTFLQDKSEAALTDEDARQSIFNALSFFGILDEWDKRDKLDAESDQAA